MRERKGYRQLRILALVQRKSYLATVVKVNV
jgi:hypothetical protein